MTEKVEPMLASPSTSAGNRQALNIDNLEGTHTFDVKLDGLRALAYWDGMGCLSLYNRNGVEITAQFPEIQADLGPNILTLDGELVACDGRFQTVATRGKQTRQAIINKAAEATPCKFVAFDLLTRSYTPKGGGTVIERARDYPYLMRRALLNDLDLPSRFERSVISPDASLLEHVASLGMEGVIAKRNDSRYVAGRSRDWIKFKVLHSITAIAIGYEAGTGSRAHFGAMRLALLTDSGGVVEIGRVGTGFTEAGIVDLKARLDAGQPTLVEIECLNRTNDGALRFPVYKGIRTDLSVLDANVSQLATLPLC